jgi:riboflavin synthase
MTRPRLGIVDTTFARFPMGDAAEDEYRKHVKDADVVRATVPGIKDLPVACKRLIEKEGCHLVMACGMVGGAEIDKVCGHEASTAIQNVMLMTNTHILEVFVHADEATHARQLAWLMDQRTREHAVNAYWMLHKPEELRARAGHGLRQGFADEGPIGGR